jgi:hypothetical protein
MNLAPIAAQKLECQLKPAAIGHWDPYFQLVRTFDLTPLQQSICLASRPPPFRPRRRRRPAGPIRRAIACSGHSTRFLTLPVCIRPFRSAGLP